MKYLWSFFIFFFVLNCSAQSDTESFLTGTTWKREEVDAAKKVVETWMFKSDGTYEDTNRAYDKNGKLELTITLSGTWKWSSTNEIETQYKTVVMNGESHAHDDPNYTHTIRISEINKNKLVGITRHFQDAEDSGFAKTYTFMASVH